MSGFNPIQPRPSRFDDSGEHDYQDLNRDQPTPGRRRWDWNIPSFIALISVLGVWFGSFMTYIIMNDRRATKTEGEIEVLKTADKGIIEHAAAVEQVSIRDRSEIREDIKEIKSTVNKIADNQRRR